MKTVERGVLEGRNGRKLEKWGDEKKQDVEGTSLTWIHEHALCKNFSLRLP